MKTKLGTSGVLSRQRLLQALIGGCCFWLLLGFSVQLSCGEEPEKIKKLDEACRAGREDACAELIEIARKNEKWEWRKAAVEKVSYLEVLKEIAGKKDEEIAVRIAAVKNINDLAFLEELCRNENDPAHWSFYPYLETRRINRGLQSGKIEIKIPPVTRTSDQEGGRIAAEVQKKHEAAIQEIRKTGERCETGDPEACSQLLQIAEGNQDSRLRGAAVEQIRDEGQLSRLARKSDDEWVVLAAVQNRHLRDQKVLGEIARDSDNEIVRRCAAQKIHDQNLLLELYGREKSSFVRMALVDQLTDEYILEEIVGNDGDLGIRHVALERYRLLKRETATEKKDRLKNQ